MKAKQLLALLLALLTLMSVLVSCGGDADTDVQTGDKETGNAVESGNDETEVMHNLPADLNFASNSNPIITFFVRTGGLYEQEMYVEEVTEDTLPDAIYWRNQTVQNQLGVEIQQIAQLCGWSNYSDWNSTLRNAIQTETHDFDMAAIYAGTGSSLAIEDCYMDLADLEYLGLDKPWWNQSLLEVATIYNSLYFAAGSITPTQLADANVLYFNKDLYNEYFATSGRKDIYDVVRDGEWTIDYMYDITSQIWEDADSNGEHSSGDTLGFVGSAKQDNGAMDSWFYALGCNLTVMDESVGEPVAAFYDEHTIQAYEKLVKLYGDNEGAWALTESGQSHGDTSFTNGNAMMTLAKFSTGSSYREVNFAFGVLPVPKFDTEQTSYIAIPEVTSSMVTVLSTVEDDRIDMVSATLELMSYESYKRVTPAYIDVVLKSKNANSPDDAEMAQTIIDSIVYSFGWIFSSTHMADMGKAFRMINRDMTNYYESRKDKYNEMLETLIDGFAALE